jgi:putative ABC transport system permease protein
MKLSDSGSSAPGTSRKKHVLSSGAAVVEAFRIAVDSIWAHKLRSILTLFGIIIGVTAVVVVGAAIEGLGFYVSDSLQNALGSNTFIVAQIAGINMSYEQYMEMIRKNKPIRLADMDTVEEKCDGCDAISPSLGRSDNIKRGNLVFEGSQVMGTSEDWPKIKDLKLSQGRYLSAYDINGATDNAVIGFEVRNELFGPVDAIGKKIRIGGDKYTVVGVEAENGSMMGQSLDTNVYIPYTTFLKKYGSRQSISFRVKSPTTEVYNYTQDEVRQILRAKRKLKPNQDDNFTILGGNDLQNVIGQLVSIITIAVVPVVAISMVVGAIVVMNIMLVVVTERTMEIGMRKSLGARKKDILLQFLVESALLASLGGVIGVLLAYGMSMIIGAVSPLPMHVTIGYIFFAILSSCGIGIISGMYPAYRAAKLDPIVALTRE